MTPLHCSSKNGYDYIVEFLIKHGADLNAKDENSLNFGF